MVEQLEQLMSVLQDQNVRVILYTASQLAGGAYVLHIFRKHVNPIVAGLALYPIKRGYLNMSLLDFLRREYMANLETNYGKKPEANPQAA